MIYVYTYCILVHMHSRQILGFKELKGSKKSLNRELFPPNNIMFVVKAYANICARKMGLAASLQRISTTGICLLEWRYRKT